ncbi:MAG: hypothetical protein HY538_08645 [Deltaproteobacteria bacterium]|nr:hypothetical protein [Deltaproteobacteria bacterium]
MKYMQNGKFQNHPLMRLTLLFTLLFLTGLWLTHLFLYFSKMGLAPQSVVDYYLGLEAEYRVPRSFDSMLEVTHMHLPMMAVVILLLTHLLIFAPFSSQFKIFFISVSFLSAFFNEMSGWLVRFVSPYFAILKVVSFLTFQVSLAFLIFAMVWFLTRRPNNGD